jgi:hypothetical protein
MLQGGGHNNVTSGCLKETFHLERSTNLALEEGRTKKAKLNGGILPCATHLTDKKSIATASAEYNKEKRNLSPALAGNVSPRRFDSTGTLTNTQRIEPYSLPHHGIGVHDVPSPPSPRTTKAEKPPSHGKTGPFGRHSIEKAFFDHVSTGNIACLH